MQLRIICWVNCISGDNRKMTKKTEQSMLMVFILGLSLLIIGFVLSVVNREETRYRNVFGFQVPYQVTVYPFQPIGVLLIFVGVVLLGVSIYKTYEKKQVEHLMQPDVTLNEQIPQGKFCTRCGKLVAIEAKFCPNCGTKLK